MTEDAVKKHRHDLGQEDHGPVMASGTTRGIQIVLGLWIAGTILVLVWAMAEAGRGPAALSKDESGAGAPAAQPR